MPLRGFEFGLQPLVKVNVEAVSAAGELPKLTPFVHLILKYFSILSIIQTRTLWNEVC